MTTYLVRHASAGQRGVSPGDLDRTLDHVGRAQAHRLVDLLADVPVDTIVSSRATRCVQTVEPLATARGLSVETHPALLEGAHGHDTLALVEQLADRDVVLCSHGDVIPDVLELLAHRGLTVTGERGFAKGSVWTLEAVDGRFTTAAYAATHL